MNGRELVDANEQQLVDAIDAELNDRDSAYEQLRVTLTNTETQLSSVSEMLSTTKSQLDASRADVEQRDRTIQQLRERVAELEAQLPADEVPELITGQNQPLSTISAYAANETPQQMRQRVIDTYGRFPMSKVFYSDLPRTWDAGREGTQPEKRVVICYEDDTNLQSHAQSIPDGWWVIYCPWQEADLKMQDGRLTQQQFTGYFTRGFPIVNAASNASRRVELWPCLAGGSGYKADAQQRAQSVQQYAGYLKPIMSLCHGVGIDCYVNPFGVPGPTGQTGLGSAYKPDGATRLSFCFDFMQVAGVRRWGVMEFGAPPRSWDSSRAERRAALNQFVDVVKQGFDLSDGTHVRAEFCLLFNQQGSQWDQRIVGPPIGNAEPWVADWRALNLASG